MIHSTASFASVSTAIVTLLRKIPSNYFAQSDPVMTMARTPQTGLSLKQLVDFGASVKAGGAARDETLIMAARFLHHELPIRFAHRIAELRHLPHGLADMPSVVRVASWCVPWKATTLKKIPSPLPSNRSIAHCAGTKGP
jgi:hypothetical protein